MKGQYSGLQARLRQDNPNLNYVHCAAHVLNLVVTDASESCKQAKYFLGLLQTTNTFLTESHKRLQVWAAVNKESAKRTTASSETTKALYNVAHDFDDFKPDVTFKAKALLENWCKFQNILIASVFGELFDLTTPTSKYLQLSGVDYLTVLKNIKTLTADIRNKRDNFQKTLDKTSEFAEYIRSTLIEGFDIEVETYLRPKRISRKKRHFDELAEDEAGNITEPKRRFQIDVYNNIFDTAILQLQSRFVSNEALFKDIEWLHSSKFEQLKSLEGGLSDYDDAMNVLSTYANVTCTYVISGDVISGGGISHIPPSLMVNSPFLTTPLFSMKRFLSNPPTSTEYSALRHQSSLYFETEVRQPSTSTQEVPQPSTSKVSLAEITEKESPKRTPFTSTALGYMSPLVMPEEIRPLPKAVARKTAIASQEPRIITASSNNVISQCAANETISEIELELDSSDNSTYGFSDHSSSSDENSLEENEIPSTNCNSSSGSDEVTKYRKESLSCWSSEHSLLM
ncbi:hypothetical protein JTE90_026936 [Oedothorax gibbosus]|uniref:Zinc finger MYM-type 1-like n=1 Tax=Oedothorax gibbosus TaxID=931172 RepID=A0AAV6TWX5_9ARAC|nr:hypothetical protein JTE90_026936 [Oedothorax gibbosus]